MSQLLYFGSQPRWVTLTGAGPHCSAWWTARPRTRGLGGPWGMWRSAPSPSDLSRHHTGEQRPPGVGRPLRPGSTSKLDRPMEHAAGDHALLADGRTAAL